MKRFSVSFTILKLFEYRLDLLMASLTSEIAMHIYLVSPDSGYLTGRVIFLDGGWMAS